MIAFLFLSSCCPSKQKLELNTCRKRIKKKTKKNNKMSAKQKFNGHKCRINKKIAKANYHSKL